MISLNFDIRAQVIDFEKLPVLDQFVILVFPGGEGTIINLSYFIILISIVAFAVSIKRSVEICGTGGVQDVFQLSADDQSAVLGILAGSEIKRSAPVKPESKKPAPKPAAAVPEPKPEAQESPSPKAPSPPKPVAET